MDQLVLFDYNTLDTETRIVAQQRAVEIKDLMRNTAENIMRVGEKLLEVQVKLGDGRFDAWLEAEFKWSRRTAYNFIGVFKEFRDHANFAQIDIATSALYLIAAPSTLESARQEIMLRAEAGERISHTAAKAVVEAHKAAEEQARPKQGSFEQGAGEQGGRGAGGQGGDDEDDGQEWLDEGEEKQAAALPPPPPAKAPVRAAPPPAPVSKTMGKTVPAQKQEEGTPPPLPAVAPAAPPPPPPPPAARAAKVEDYHLHVTIKSTGICLVTLTQVGRVEPLANLSVHRDDLTGHIERVLAEKVSA